MISPLQGVPNYGCNPCYGGEPINQTSAPVPTPLIPPYMLIVLTLLAIFVVLLVVAYWDQDDRKRLVDFRKWRTTEALSMNGKLIITPTKIYRVKLVEIELKEKES